VRLDVYVTQDSKPGASAGDSDNCYLFEGPRKLNNGSHLCCGLSFLGEQHPLVLIWKPGQDLATAPQVIPVPEPDRRIRGLQGTWYQTEEGRIWMFLRDAGLSTRLAVSCSDDGGRTWSDVLLSDMPNTFSRAFCRAPGRRPLLPHRQQLRTSCSTAEPFRSPSATTDGKFTRMYTLVQGKTHRRFDGLHKEDGWHYPNAIVDGDNLIVIFSVNKEDICCGVANARDMA